MYAFEFASGLKFSGSTDVNGKPQAATFTYDDLASAAQTITIRPPDYEETGKLTELKDAIEEVLDAASLRPDRMAEILTQVGPPTAFFAMVLNLQPGRHRCTLELMSTVFGLTSLVTQPCKHHFRARRPADRSVLVQPVIQTPRHGAYPAGHATQCAFVAEVLKAVVGTATAGSAGNDFTTQVDALAKRISENRVVAGLHYNEDNVAGKELGEKLARYLLDVCAKREGSALHWLLGKASDEWGQTWAPAPVP